MARPHPALIEIAAGRVPDHLDDPAAVISTSREHRMWGLLWSAIQRGEVEMPESILRVLSRERMATRVWEQSLWSAVDTVAEALDVIEVEFAVFKGVATGSRFYAPGERPAADVDVFIDPSSRHRLAEVVSALNADHPLAHTIQRYIDNGRMLSVDVQLPSGVWVDIHADPVKVGVPLRRLDELWAMTTFLEATSGRRIRVLNPEASLIQAVVHLQKDRYSHLIGMADIQRIASSPGLDWDRVEDFVHSEGIDAHFWSSLSYVADTLAVDLPRRPVGGWRAWLWNRLWPERSRLQGYVGMTRKVRTWYWIPFTIRGRFFAALRWWLGVVFPTKEQIAYAHPEVSGPYLKQLFSYRFRLGLDRHQRNVEQRRRGETFRRAIFDRSEDEDAGG